MIVIFGHSHNHQIHHIDDNCRPVNSAHDNDNDNDSNEKEIKIISIIITKKIIIMIVTQSIQHMA